MDLHPARGRARPGRRRRRRLIVSGSNGQFPDEDYPHLTKHEVADLRDSIRGLNITLIEANRLIRQLTDANRTLAEIQREALTRRKKRKRAA